MSNEEPPLSERSKDRTPAPAELQPEEKIDLVGDTEFKKVFGEDLTRTLDIDSWATAVDWEAAVERFTTEIKSALGREERVRETIRNQVLPRIATRPNAPKEAGVYRTVPSELENVHDGLLFPGRVEAVDGTSVTYDSLPLGITQIGISVVSYGGATATFAQRIFRKEITKATDPYKEALELISGRDGRQGVNQKDGLSELGRRGIMAYAERKILLDKSSADWRMGHGAPCPYELLTGSGSMTLLHAALDMLRRLILDQKRFVFVPSAPSERGLLTLGHALAAGEYAVIDTIEQRMEAVVESGHYGESHKDEARRFVRDCGGQVLRGLYRASEHSPPYMFYAHREHIHIAARIAIADSILRPERGFPMLIDVADATCRNAFGADGFFGLVHDAYTKIGAPMRFTGERETRR
jgi:hypothetical protein